MAVDATTIDVVTEQISFVTLFVFIVLVFLFFRYTLKKTIKWPDDEMLGASVQEDSEATLEDKLRQNVVLEINELSVDELETVAAWLRSRKHQDED